MRPQHNLSNLQFGAVATSMLLLRAIGGLVYCRLAASKAPQPSLVKAGYMARFTKHDIRKRQSVWSSVDPCGHRWDDVARAGEGLKGAFVGLALEK